MKKIRRIRILDLCLQLNTPALLVECRHVVHVDVETFNVAGGQWVIDDKPRPVGCFCQVATSK